MGGSCPFPFLIRIEGRLIVDGPGVFSPPVREARHDTTTSAGSVKTSLAIDAGSVTSPNRTVARENLQ